MPLDAYRWSALPAFSTHPAAAPPTVRTAAVLTHYRPLRRQPRAWLRALLALVRPPRRVLPLRTFNRRGGAV
eukprot:4469410-Pleurochrysis_carterae.AAC.1